MPITFWQIVPSMMHLRQPFVYIYTTIFFVTIGASVNLRVLNPLMPENREGLVIAGGGAIAVKAIAGYAPFGDKPINRFAIGTSMTLRGKVGLIVAGLGASTGVLSESLDAAVLIMVVVTTLIAPILQIHLSRTFHHQRDQRSSQ
ncbi:High-affinity Na(+)/H(+) antiporter NhaS3 [Acaryochloris thomasi RCC1774]|uniref:High-affinity Na(+)/H(+) antiporter NhaS3 n=1 Tax=Acaryochloris thomasi RCC1774 TaxID=1764569 RepID=A0A2W1JJD2_9CYAN|nr:cation:proton antiporter [Acaryochloris thomasi]PZD73346.1 High-affinity Na(+)/H(+) antiporter NhaS3 [Acaryochloris thomasi RCC1774]